MAPKPKVQSKKHVARLERERRQVRLIRIIAIAVVAVVLLIIAYGYLEVTFLQGRQPVAEVNGEKISTKEFQARTVMQRSQLLNQYVQYLQYQQSFGLDVTTQLEQIQTSLDTPTIIGQQVIDLLIDGALIRQEAERRGISVTPEELESFKREQFGFFPDGTPTPTITPTIVDFSYPTLSTEQLELVTATPVVTQEPTATALPTATPDLDATPTATPIPLPTATPYTLEGYQEQFDNALQGVKEAGLNAEQYNRLFETELLRMKLYEQVTADTPAEEEQIWARHILVQDEETAKQVIERLNNGEDFGTLAMELSEDTGSGAQGGDLGWFGKGRMVPAFETAAYDLQVGEISEPVQSNFGWHIIQLLGRTTVPLSASAYDSARQSAFTDFLASLREEADIVTYDDIWTARVPTRPSLQDLQQAQ